MDSIYTVTESVNYQIKSSNQIYFVTQNYKIQ